jgi:hypothetical protein
MSVRFEVWANGEHLCTPGLPGYGVLTVGLTSVERNPERVANMKHVRSFEELVTPELFLEVGAWTAGKHWLIPS